MKPLHQHIINYTSAMQQQQHLEQGVNLALQLLNPDNQVFALADPVEGAYTNLVQELCGPELWEWLQWWIYECDYGTRPMQFTIDNTHCDPTKLTLQQFLETVDAA